MFYFCRDVTVMLDMKEKTENGCLLHFVTISLSFLFIDSFFWMLPTSFYHSHLYIDVLGV